MELSFYQIVRFAANIMVGNTILLNTSMVPQCGIAMEELFKEAQAQKDYTPIY
jgi:succinate-semialdehyde dehydrogenase/glutarate-semialdehyde dehydrogenase